MNILAGLVKSLFESSLMFWDVLWPLILGFFLSAVIQALVSHKTIAKNLGKDNIRCISLASLLGAASSSCSYAAVALARSIFTKGASFLSSMVFQIASTNLVIELGLVLWILMGWQFALAEWIGGVIMIAILSLFLKSTLSKDMIDMAKKQAKKGFLGRMEGHASMDMSIDKKGSFWSRLFSSKGFTAVSHFFVMDWLSILTDLFLGFIIAGALEVFVPKTFWQAFFFSGNSTMSFIEGPLIGPLVAIFSFVCSVGNVPLAAVLWNGGISFGGVISFIFADLIIIPILNIYRKYYGKKVMLYILGAFYITMAIAGYIIESLFDLLKIVPLDRNLEVFKVGFQFNYTAILNILFLILAIVLIKRFLRTNGMMMVQMMNKPSTHKE